MMISDILFNPITQLIAALLIVIIVMKFVVPLFFRELKGLEKEENTFRTIDTYKAIKLIDGVMSLSANEAYLTTANKMDLDYVNIPRSINSKGGSEFSFSFWFNKGKQINTDSLANKVLLIYGLKNQENLITKQPYTFENELEDNSTMLDNQYETVLEPKDYGKVIEYPAKNANNKNYRSFQIQVDNEVIVKCPLIKFADDGKSIEVEVNTLNKVSKKVKIQSDALEILSADAWNLLTFTFEDFKDFTGFASGIKICFYINEQQVSTQIIKDDALKVNNGNIYILPSMTNIDVDQSQKGGIADLTYHNRSINATQIKDLVVKRFNDNVYKTPRMSRKADITRKYNSMNMYNETYQL